MSKRYVELDAVKNCLDNVSGDFFVSEARHYYGEYFGVDDLSAVPKEMSAVEFAKQINRMCEATCCSGCPIESWCYYRMPTHIDEAIPIVEAWAKEHPERSENNGEM